MDPFGGEPIQPPIDWVDWNLTLQRFAAATGVAVSAFDHALQRRAGPMYSSKVTRLLAAGGAWEQDGAALGIEQDLVRAVLRGGHEETHLVERELQLRAMPLLADGQVRGAVVYGWVFNTFSTSLACQRLGVALGIDPSRLWAEARMEAPTPASRLVVYGELLETLAAAAVRHAQAVQRLEELSKLREVFLAGVSHELRTPLAALGMRIEVLLRSPLDDAASMRASLQKMKQQVATEARLVEDLIDSARTRNGQLSIDRSRLLFNDAVFAALASVGPQAESKQIALSAPTWPREIWIDGDGHRLQQVFWNVLANAVKFTPAGGSINVEVNVSDASVNVSVADTGSGIDAEMIPRVFEAFTKQHRSNAQGLGLGLSIARHIVELHGGSIWVESAGRDAGATFHVRLPMAAPP